MSAFEEKFISKYDQFDSIYSVKTNLLHFPCFVTTHDFQRKFQEKSDLKKLHCFIVLNENFSTCKTLN